ncbi:hypothetical protein ABIB85_002956 [Bradyrhizobium sp. JR1.5]|jgi:branched-chain amino acid transport system substrate-binding protein
MKIDDMFTSNGKLRADGLMEHENHAAQENRGVQTTFGLL